MAGKGSPNLGIAHKRVYPAAGKVSLILRILLERVYTAVSGVYYFLLSRI